LTEKDVKDLSGEDRAAVVDFGLWMDAREVDEKLRLERESTSQQPIDSSSSKISSIKDARAAALAAALSKAAANVNNSK
jgi:hypothetical protein